MRSIPDSRLLYCGSRCGYGRSSTRDLRSSRIAGCGVEYLVEKKVFWFEVAVDDELLVHVLESEGYLAHDIASLLLGEFLFLLHLLQTPVGQQLEDEV